MAYGMGIVLVPVVITVGVMIMVIVMVMVMVMARSRYIGVEAINNIEISLKEAVRACDRVKGRVEHQNTVPDGYNRPTRWLWVRVVERSVGYGNR